MKNRGFIGGRDEAVKLALDAARRQSDAFCVTVTAILELVRRMRRDDFSRNRNYDAFEGADGGATRARRLWRYLRSLERDLAANADRIGDGVTYASSRTTKAAVGSRSRSRRSACDGRRTCPPRSTRSSATIRMLVVLLDAVDGGSLSATLPRPEQRSSRKRW